MLWIGTLKLKFFLKPHFKNGRTSLLSILSCRLKRFPFVWNGMEDPLPWTLEARLCTGPYPQIGIVKEK